MTFAPGGNPAAGAQVKASAFVIFGSSAAFAGLADGPKKPIATTADSRSVSRKFLELMIFLPSVARRYFTAIVALRVGVAIGESSA